MGLINTIRQHAAMASGNFSVILKDAEIPPLPAAVSRLLSEISRPDQDVQLELCKGSVYRGLEGLAVTLLCFTIVSFSQSDIPKPIERRPYPPVVG